MSGIGDREIMAIYALTLLGWTRSISISVPFIPRPAQPV